MIAADMCLPLALPPMHVKHVSEQKGVTLQAEGRAEKAEQARAAAEAARESAERLRQQIQAEAEVGMLIC